MHADKQKWIMPMRADKDFRTYEQALTIVQRLGELAEVDHKNGKHAEAQYHLARATFVGVKHLLFMAADAAVDRAEARQLAEKNHLTTIELLSLTLASMGGEGDSKEDDAPDARAANGQGRPGNVSGKSGKATRKTIGASGDARPASKRSSSGAGKNTKGGLRERRR